MKDITYLCKRVICVHNGTISYDGKLDKLLKRLSPVKDILIICRTEKEADKIFYSGYEIKSRSKNEITLKVEGNNIIPILKEIINRYDVEDLFINEPPIDEIVGKILVEKKI